MFRRLVERFNAVHTQELCYATIGVWIVAFDIQFVSYEYTDDWIDRYVHRQKALKDTSGRRDGY